MARASATALPEAGADELLVHLPSGSGRSPTRTKVALEHRNLDRHGEGWEAVRGGVDSDQGWPLYLDRYAELVAGGL